MLTESGTDGTKVSEAERVKVPSVLGGPEQLISSAGPRRRTSGTQLSHCKYGQQTNQDLLEFVEMTKCWKING